MARNRGNRSGKGWMGCRGPRGRGRGKSKRRSGDGGGELILDDETGHFRCQGCGAVHHDIRTEDAIVEIDDRTAERLDRFRREGESFSEALERLMDGHDEPEPDPIQCAECGSTVDTLYRDQEGRILCSDHAGVGDA